MIAKYLGGEKENKKNLTEKLTKIAKGKDVGLATEAQVKAAKKAAHDSSVSGSIGNAWDYFSGNEAAAKKEEEKKAEAARKKEEKRKADNLKARKAREEKKAKEEAAKKTAKTPAIPVKD